MKIRSLGITEKLLLKPRPRYRRLLPLLLLLSLPLWSCVKPAQKVVILPYFYEGDPFIQHLTNKIIQEIPSNYEVEMFDAQNSQIIQNEFIERAMQEQVDLLIINPVDRLGVYPIIKRLRAEGIPVIFFNREPLERDMALWDRIYYIGGPAEQSGELQADMIEDLYYSTSAQHPESVEEGAQTSSNTPDTTIKNLLDTNEDGRIQMVIFKGEQGHQDAEIRTHTVIQTLTQRRLPVDIVSIEPGNWSYGTAYTLMGELLDRTDLHIEAVVSNNDAMALGAIAKLRQRGFLQDTNENGMVDVRDTNWIPVIGIDGIPEAVESIQNGHLYGTVLNDLETQAKVIGDLAKGILDKNPGNRLPYSFERNQYYWVDYKAFSRD